MKHRDRVQAAINHEMPDRCPMHISFTPEFKKRLGNEIVKHPNHFNQRIYLNRPFGLECVLDQDMLLSFSGRLSDDTEQNQQTLADGSIVDEWGVINKNISYHTRFGRGYYLEMVEHPLIEDHKISSYQPPDPNNPSLYLEAEMLINEYQEEYWIVGCVVTTIFETAWALRGFENLLMDFIADPDLADELLDIPFQYHKTVAKRLTKMGVDMVWFGDDVGAQDAMLISPKTWRKFLKSRMAELIAVVKNINPNVKVAYHSDGYIYPIIPDLIEIGLDVLNPIQPNCMNPEQLKGEYGDQLCFWGTIDEQHLLPFASPEEVRYEILHLIRTVGKDGGLILSPTHNVQLDTPMDNFWAMVETICQTSCGLNDNH